MNKMDNERHALESKPKHTAGPWKTNFSNLFGKWTVFDPFNSIIAELPGKKTLINDDEMGANADLIASAPDMAAEIERLKAINKTLVEIMKDIKYKLKINQCNPALNPGINCGSYSTHLSDLDSYVICKKIQSAIDATEGGE